MTQRVVSRVTVEIVHSEQLEAQAPILHGQLVVGQEETHSLAQVSQFGSNTTLTSNDKFWVSFVILMFSIYTKIQTLNIWVPTISIFFGTLRVHKYVTSGAHVVCVCRQLTVVVSQEARQ